MINAMNKQRVSKTRLYIIWSHMKQRCYNPNSNKYNLYGKRGITVCDEWKASFDCFKNWAIMNGYNEKLTLDRKNYNGNYESSNCRWITMKEQANNMRSNHLLTMNGETHTISEWAEITGIKRGTIEQRINRLKWDTISALTTQPREIKRYSRKEVT